MRIEREQHHGSPINPFYTEEIMIIREVNWIQKNWYEHHIVTMWANNQPNINKVVSWQNHYEGCCGWSSSIAMFQYCKLSKICPGWYLFKTWIWSNNSFADSALSKLNTIAAFFDQLNSIFSLYSEVQRIWIRHWGVQDDFYYGSKSVSNCE